MLLLSYRTKRFKLFKEFKRRILVATDIFGRGIDIERINIVINYDMADSSDSYLHRVGRAGRFGTKGLTVSFVSSDNDKKVLSEIQSRFVVKIQAYPTSGHVDAAAHSKLLNINILY